MEDCMSKNYVASQLSQAALFEQLAEECTELAQAALKMARLERGENPTPMLLEEIQANLVEEISDVDLVLSVLNINPSARIQERKLARWVGRIEEARERGSKPVRQGEESCAVMTGELS